MYICYEYSMYVSHIRISGYVTFLLPSIFFIRKLVLLRVSSMGESTHTHTHIYIYIYIKMTSSTSEFECGSGGLCFNNYTPRGFLSVKDAKS